MARRLQKTGRHCNGERDQQEPGRYPRQTAMPVLRAVAQTEPDQGKKAIEKAAIVAARTKGSILPRPRLNPAIRLSTLSPAERAIRPGHVVTFEASFSASSLDRH